MNRCVEPEWLDELPSTDPRALGSRSDLRRLNQWMCNVSILARELGNIPKEGDPVRIVELGAGDGNFLARVARRLGTDWQGTQATLLDRQNVIAEDATQNLQELRWEVTVDTRDVFDWCQETGTQKRVVVVANLFLHHFAPDRLEVLLRGIARHSSFFVAVEPRRSWVALAFSRLVGVIGCNEVTRHDAPVSVRAGFAECELTQLWPQDGIWRTSENRAGLFGHVFVARAVSK
jgi:hypothetical protein